MIESYRFGRIVIDGKTYNYDVEIRSAGDILPWKREKSHIIDIESVERAVEQNPEMIIIGTGESGMAKVKEETKEFIKEKGIRLIINITSKAVEVFNKEINGGKKIIGLFHLTC